MSSLGAALLLNGQADRAEAVFRIDLEQYPAKSTFAVRPRQGALEAQHKTERVEEVRREFDTAWKDADELLRL